MITENVINRLKMFQKKHMTMLSARHTKKLCLLIYCYRLVILMKLTWFKVITLRVAATVILLFLKSFLATTPPALVGAHDTAAAPVAVTSHSFSGS